MVAFLFEEKREERKKRVGREREGGREREREKEREKETEIHEGWRGEGNEERIKSSHICPSSLTHTHLPQ